MALGEIEIKILVALKDAYDNPPNKFGALQYQELADKAGLDVQILVSQYYQTLKKAGYVENPFTITTLIKISHKGIDYLDNKGKEEQPIQHQTINNPQNCPISQSGNATINITNKFLQELENAINKSPDLNTEEKHSWLGRIKEIGASVVLSKAFEVALKAATGSPS